MSRDSYDSIDDQQAIVDKIEALRDQSEELTYLSSPLTCFERDVVEFKDYLETEDDTVHWHENAVSSSPTFFKPFAAIEMTQKVIEWTNLLQVNDFVREHNSFASMQVEMCRLMTWKADLYLEISRQRKDLTLVELQKIIRFLLPLKSFGVPFKNVLGFILPFSVTSQASVDEIFYFHKTIESKKREIIYKLQTTIFFGKPELSNAIIELCMVFFQRLVEEILKPCLNKVIEAFSCFCRTEKDVGLMKADFDAVETIPNWKSRIDLERYYRFVAIERSSLSVSQPPATVSLL